MSTPASASSQNPESWPRTRMPAYIRSQVAVSSSRPLPSTSGASRSSMIAAVARPPTGAFASPQPVTPSDVVTFTSTVSMVSL
jgi:hypothetical protein